eukprot:358375-Chlamydomonas_euryale.AAC.7
MYRTLGPMQAIRSLQSTTLASARVRPSQGRPGHQAYCRCIKHVIARAPWDVRSRDSALVIVRLDGPDAVNFLKKGGVWLHYAKLHHAALQSAVFRSLQFRFLT